MLRGVVAVLIALQTAPPVDPAPVPTASSEPAADGEDTVADLEARAQAAFATGDYDEVAEVTRRAYAVTGDIRHLYANAQAVRLAGRCREAAVLYARVLASAEDPALAEHAQEGMRLCESELQTVPTPPPAHDDRSVSSPDEPPDDPAPPPIVAARDEPRPWLRDGLAVGLLAGGAGVLAIGAGLQLQVRADTRAVDRAADDVTHNRFARRATQLQAGAAVAWSIGSALVVGAVVRYVIVAVRQKRRHARLLPRSAIAATRRLR